MDCVVWWARIDDYRPELDSLLSPVESARAARLRQPEDRVRQVLGAALLRLAAASQTEASAGAVVVDRTCSRCAEAHGRPTLPGTGLHASITHSGGLVGLALTRAAPVGLDVERVSGIDIEGLSPSVLHASERAESPNPSGFLTYWTRKEAVVKTTGDGLNTALADVQVTGPMDPAALLSYPGRARLPAYLADLHPAEGYRAAVAILTAAPVGVLERPASRLLCALPFSP
ncbi:4'-phosphopantetheinyl transferase superfamily protein [Micromonospora sp. WMMD1082]|uniref:4'-phosphopantetheinyl transferase family protein n=1 Tax=Micromonospora sp. WMMD1082 TaxID=3016104 RepID=UPI0024179E2F|nr:4'-phosphopantetheinyl transferase superfamily protein [Micromonospora sp. WMMD1082]MDG4793470.1 4'-phosphopantetheinyl transferase superfamily protein [Micromonospora sp. WMMD1082]